MKSAMFCVVLHDDDDVSARYVLSTHGGAVLTVVGDFVSVFAAPVAEIIVNRKRTIK